MFYACSSGENKEQTQENQKESNVESAPVEETRNILFFGNSLTAGYGLEMSQAFPALIQEKIDSLGLNYNVINAGLSGETTAAGKNRVEWVLKQPVDIFVLELGANDGLRGIKPEETKKNLQEIIDKVKTTYPEAKILLIGMQIPPSMGQTYTSQFREIYPDLAHENDISLVPFLLDRVGGERHLNIEDGIHPNVEGHKILAENVWPEMRKLLDEG